MFFGKVSTLLTFAGATLAQSSSSCNAPIFKLEGYGSGTTGGGSATPVYVKTCAELQAAASQGGVIRVLGFLNDCGTIDLVDNTTLEGGDGRASIYKGGVRIENARNVIVRNIGFNWPLVGEPALAVNSSTQIWINHNDFNIGESKNKDDYGAELEIINSDLVTVSWNLLMQSWKGAISQGNESSGLQEDAQSRITYHHNFFFYVRSNSPSVHGATAHIYSNCIDAVQDEGVSVSHGAKALIENNSFGGVTQAIVTDMDPENEGSVTERNNEFYSSPIKITKTGHVEPPYDYSLDSPSCICDYVCSYSGKYFLS